MKLSTLLSARKVIMNHINDRLPSNLAYKFMKLIRASDNDGAFYNEKINKIIVEFADKDADGKIKTEGDDILFDPTRADECNAAINELQLTEVDKPNVTFTIQELEPLVISISEIAALNEFIIDIGG